MSDVAVRAMPIVAAIEEADMRVEQLMSPDVVTIGPAASGFDAVALMVRARARHLPVVNRDGLLVGIVTDRDLRHHLFSPEVFGRWPTRSVDEILDTVRVAEIMSTDVLTVEPEATLAEAAAVMHAERVGSLPVVDHGRLVGILTEIDLLRHVVAASPTCTPACVDIVVPYP